MRPFLLALAALALVACGPPATNDDERRADGGGGGGSDGGLTEITWYRDVMPITQTRCFGCHRPGGIGPFAMETYADVKPWADSMALAVDTGFMPPWPPDDGCQPFQDDRRITQPQIDTIVAWANGGAVEGDPADAPGDPPPAAKLPRVDLVLDAGIDYTPNDQGGSDDYRCLIVDPALPASTKVVGVNVLPGLGRMVHHVLLYPAPRGDAATRDQGEAGPGWTCFGAPGVGSGLTVGGWAPGTAATVYPDGTGIQLSSNDVLVMQVHYNLDNGSPAPDRTRVELMLDSSVTAAYMVPLLDSSFRIPPQTVGASTTNSIGTFGLSGRAWGAFPHMHQLGRTIDVKIRHAGGSETCLMRISDWDFNWQGFYWYDRPDGVAISGTDQLEITCTWDNPTNRTITWGDGTDDEMCLNYLYTTLQ